LDIIIQCDLLRDRRMLQGSSVISHPSPATEKFLRAVLEKTKDRQVRGRACLALGTLLDDRAVVAKDPWFGKLSKTPFGVFLDGRLHPNIVKYILETDRQASTDESERLLERAVDEFGDVVYRARKNPADRDRTVADVARSKLNERLLAVGRVGPEIEGIDLDGKPMKLSDYRGKVVLLSFWGAWCAPCMDLVPHEREIAARLAGKSFALLGVNSDEEQEQARTVRDRERMTWRSWWDGKPPGPIADRWNAGPWPTLYVLDAKGVIRYKGHGRDGLDEAIDTVIRKAQESARP
jgi:thiol-disulfide isomerase/thioredoxin